MSSGNPQSGVKYNQDYYVKQLALYSTGFAPIDLKPIFVELSYFEDIFSNYTSGNLMVGDSQNMIQKFGMNGNEYIRLTFGKDDDESFSIDKLFRVYKVTSREKQPNGESETYVIHFCSDEGILNEQYKISRAYPNWAISDIVADILIENLKVPSVKFGFIEPTIGTYNMIVPYLNPFEAINWLSTYALPKNNIGADMVFFENSQGYNFISLQTLYARPTIGQFSFNPKNVDFSGSNLNKTIFNISAYEILNSFNSLEHVTNGTYANRLLSVDPLLRRFKTTDFNYNIHQAISQSLNPYPVINNLQNRNGDALYDTNMANFKLSIGNSTQTDSEYVKNRPGSVTPDSFFEVFKTNRKAQLNLLNHTRLKFYITGNPAFSVGNTIDFELMDGSPPTSTQQKTLDEYYSGKYLITAVRHLIQPQAYNVVVEISKDSVPTQYSNVNNTSPNLGPLVTGNLI